MEACFQNNIEVIKSSPETVRDLEAISATALQNLKGTIFSAEALDMVQSYLAESRKTARTADAAK